jgi:4-hydroxy-3-polyprenylbenzoate decarboxylase
VSGGETPTPILIKASQANSPTPHGLVADARLEKYVGARRCTTVCNRRGRIEVPYRDLKEFISALEGIGEIRKVEGADWDLEIGTIAELNYERLGPAMLFDSIKDYPKGYRILTNAMDTRRRALLALNAPVDLDMDGALEAYEKKIASYRPVPPVEVKDGPLFENTFRGKEINLWKFPAPRWHEGDGGRYLGTGCMVVMRDPDSGVVNFGCYRVMVQDERTAGLYITPNKTGAIIRRKYWERKQSCPVTVSFGQEPVMFLGASPDLGQKRGMFKYELVGHVRGAPVEVVREEMTGLPVPATAEIVIAGEVPPLEEEARDEGPLGEWTGYYASGTRPEPVIRVKALYHRNAPIILGMPPQKYRRAAGLFGIPSRTKNHIEHLRKAGVEDVLDVWQLAVPGVTVVQIRQRYPGHVMKAALAASGDYMGRFVVVVDEDVNPRDPEEVLWAIGTRCDPETSITILKACQSSALDPRIPPERKKKRDFTSSRAIIDACKPYAWIKEFPATNVASPELRGKVLEKWKELF